MTQRRALNKLSFLLIILVYISSSTARLSVVPTSPYCTRLTATLDCNFEGVDKPVILDRFDSEAEKEINEVFIRNVKQLTVTGSICVKLHLNAVSMAIFSRPHVCHQKENLSLRITNSNVNMIPKYVTKVAMESSTADEFISELQFQSLTIFRSKIGTLDIEKPIANNVVVRIEHSDIKSMEKLKLENRAQLMMFNTTISQIKRNGLEISDASANIWLSTIKRVEVESISLGTKATIALEGIDGKVTLAGPNEMTNGDSTEPRPPQVPNIKRPRNNDSSNYFWMIPTIFATVEAMIIMINCTNWFPALKNIPKKREIEDGARLLSISREPSMHYGQDGQSSVYYGSEGFNTSSLNKRSKVGKDI